MGKRYKNMREDVKKIALVGLVALSLSGCSKNPESSIGNFDANGDGISDVVIFDGENRDYFAFLGQKDGTFKKADIVTQDGIPFYRVGNTTYDPWGNSFDNSLH